MSECNRGTPLTKGAREGLCEEARRVWGTRFQRFSADTIFDFEATVAALEAELATSRIDAIGSDDSASYEHGVAIEAEERVAALEAELDGCRSGSAMWEDGARYESKKRADAEAEVERLTPLAEVGGAVDPVLLCVLGIAIDATVDGDFSGASFDQLAEEVMELHLAMRARHEDTPAMEWIEIASIAVNVLRQLGASEVAMACAAWRCKHGMDTALAALYAAKGESD